MLDEPKELRELLDSIEVVQRSFQPQLLDPLATIVNGLRCRDSCRFYTMSYDKDNDSDDDSSDCYYQLTGSCEHEILRRRTG